MKATDLMIGDWVYDTMRQENKKVTRMDFERNPMNGVYYAETLLPIPITSDILEKNGFEKCHNDEAPVEECYFYRLFAKPCGWFDIDAFGLEEELGAEFVYNDVALNYVHQLQHLLRLVGIKKEVQL